MAISFSIADSSTLGQRTVLTVSGELDTWMTRDLERWLDSLSTTSRGVVVDLSAVTSVSESCVEEIARAARRLTDNGRRLRVIARDDRVAEGFRAAGLTEVVEPDRRDRIRG